MKAFIIDRYGSGARLRPGEMPDPVMQEDDVLVQIHAAGVNQLDSKTRSGEFKRLLPYRLPLILGNDVAGVALRVGERVRRFKPGDEVYARPDQDRIGTFAELISIKEDSVAKKPKNLTMEEAASVPLVGLDRLASADREGWSEEGAEGFYPSRLGRRRHHLHHSVEGDTRVGASDA